MINLTHWLWVYYRRFSGDHHPDPKYLRHWYFEVWVSIISNDSYTYENTFKLVFFPFLGKGDFSGRSTMSSSNHVKKIVLISLIVLCIVKLSFHRNIH